MAEKRQDTNNTQSNKIELDGAKKRTIPDEFLRPRQLENMYNFDDLWKLIHQFLDFYNPVYVVSYPLLYIYFRTWPSVESFTLYFFWVLVIILYRLFWYWEPYMRNQYREPAVISDWSKHIVVITGGSSGLGLLMTLTLSKAGARVVILDIHPPPAGLSSLVTYYKCDIGEPNEIEMVSQKLNQEHGLPTILINNAAVVTGKSITELSYAEIQRSFNVNLLSHYYMVKVFLPALTSTNGCIVTISSSLAHIGLSKLSMYCASRAALLSFHEALTAELQQTSVRTILAEPGQLSTPLFHSVDTPSRYLAPIIDPQDVVSLLVAKLESGFGGEVYTPLYTWLMPGLRGMPSGATWYLRYLTGADEAMDKFKRPKYNTYEEK